MVLDEKDAEEVREGYRVAFSRCSLGRPNGCTRERELAEEYRTKAEAVENAGYFRFAEALRKLADGCDREAERVIRGHHNDL